MIEKKAGAELMDNSECVDPLMGCPLCTEIRVDKLSWFDPGTGPFPKYQHEYVGCESCGTAYDPNHDYTIGNPRLNIH